MNSKAALRGRARVISRCGTSPDPHLALPLIRLKGRVKVRVKVRGLKFRGRGRVKARATVTVRIRSRVWGTVRVGSPESDLALPAIDAQVDAIEAGRIRLISRLGLGAGAGRVYITAARDRLRLRLSCFVITGGHKGR